MSEGIARYFERGSYTVGDTEVEFPRYTDWYTREPNHVYHLGHRLVSPIIEKHGHEGILYLLARPPKDTVSLGNYQEEALALLGQLDE